MKYSYDLLYDIIRIKNTKVYEIADKTVTPICVCMRRQGSHKIWFSIGIFIFLVISCAMSLFSTITYGMHSFRGMYISPTERNTLYVRNSRLRDLEHVDIAYYVVTLIPKREYVILLTYLRHPMERD